MIKQTIYLGTYGDVRDIFQSIDADHSQVITLIIGFPGHGKTSLAVALGKENMSYKQISKYKDACAKIDYLNTHKRANFRYPPEKHLVYSTDVKISNFSPKMTSYDFNSWRTGLNDPTYTTQYFPKHSLRIWDEIQKSFPSQQDQENSKIPLRVSTEFQKNRHYDIYTIGTAQDGMDVHSKLRKLASFIVAQKVISKRNKFNTVTQTVWKTLYFVNRYGYEAYVSNNGDESFANKEITFVMNGDIGRYYNRTSCEKEFDEVDNKYCEYDQLYEEVNSLIAPPGYSKKISNKKEIKSEKN